MDKKKTTPVMQQFAEAKAAHPDAVLFFRMGDFYEMFYDDAIYVSKALSLTLTSRSKEDNVPMAGVPFHAAHGYIAKLLALGQKVAICEQIGDPSKIKGIVPRKVVRVVTPGLVTEVDQLDAKNNCFLAAADGEGQGPFGLALLDLSTGELAATIVPDTAALIAEIGRADAREILLPSALAELRAAVESVAPRAAVRAEDPIEDDDVGRVIDDAVEVPFSADALRDHPLACVRAAARAIRFAKRCTPEAALPVRRIAPYDPSAALCIDETAQLHLELVRASDGGAKGSLLGTIDATITPAGARLLRRRLLAPLKDLHAIRERLDQVELFVRHARARAELRDALAGVGDLERLSVRTSLGEATPRDLGGIRDGLAAAPFAVAAIRTIPEPAAVAQLGADVDLCPDLGSRLASMLVDKPPPHAREGGVIRDGADPALDEQRRIKQSGTELIAALEQKLREQTGATSLRIRYTSVFGYYIEVTKTHLAKVPATWRRKQTVAGGERYTNPELDELADRVMHAGDRELARETELFRALVSEAGASAERVRRLASALASWDVASALADVAHRFDYARPEVDAGDAIVIEDGRHPVVERYAAEGRFVPNDTRLDLGGERLWLITGPNMAGKSTLMRQVALIVILAQMGAYVPARAARIGLVDRVLSRVGASDNLARGESTFMVEMRETAAILREATRRSLVILDEIGRGTSTYDGLAIAWAVAEHLHDVVGCRALFATHYHELTDLAKEARGIANHSVAAREHGDDVVFLHKLVAGPASRSYGIAVAKLAGIGEGVLARAKAILSTLEAGAALPSGRHASLRGRNRAGQAQLDLFAPAAPKNEAPPAVVETLRAVDTNRITPMEALQLLSKLKSMAG